MDSLELRSYAMEKPRVKKRRHMGEILAAIFLLMSVFILLVTATQAVQLRSIVLRTQEASALPAIVQTVDGESEGQL